MLISIEGCLGVGKTTLVKRFAEQVSCTAIYEDVANNPFLLDFYRDQERYALHVQYTFLLLQERLFRLAAEQAGKERNTSTRRQKQPLITGAKTPRSEERRVGKECRSRWSPY